MQTATQPLEAPGAGTATQPVQAPGSVPEGQPTCELDLSAASDSEADQLCVNGSLDDEIHRDRSPDRDVTKDEIDPFLLPSVPSGQAGPAFGPDRAHTITTTTSSSVDMVSPLENLYHDPDPEPVFAEPASSGPVSSVEQCAETLPVSAQDIIQPEQAEEGELSELEDQPDITDTETDRAISGDQNYRETVRGVIAFMGWSHIPDLEYSPTTRADNPWVGHRSQPVGKVSILLPPEDWLCKKLENLNLVLIEGYPSKSSEPGGLHMDQYLCPLKSQSRWYRIHPAF